MACAVPVITLLGVPIARLEPAAALDLIEALYSQRGPFLISYANAHTLNIAARDPIYRDVLRRARLVLNDGSGVALAARINGSRFPANLNGTDLNPELLRRAAATARPVYLLGGRPGVAEAAAQRLSARIKGLEVAGVHHGYFALDESEAVAARIRTSGARLLMAGMGNPLQELWLDTYLPATGATVGIGVGAFLDFAAGRVPRAPDLMRRAGIEWLYRLGLEPARMWRRYVLGNPLFAARVVLERMKLLRFE